MSRFARLLLATAATGVLTAAPAMAVNDPHVPADECSKSGEAAGHPAIGDEQSDQADPPFSSNNPGESDGAQGQDSWQATDNCRNAD